MFQFLLSRLSFVFVLNALVKPLWVFGVDRVFQNRIGAEGYGAYFSLFSLSLILNFLLDFGMTSSNMRAVARQTVSKKMGFAQHLQVRALLLMAYMTILLLVGLLLNLSMFSLSLLAILGLNQVLNQNILFLRSHLSGNQKFGLDSIFSVLDKFLLVVFLGGCFLIYADFVPSVMQFAAAQTTVYLFVFALLLGGSKHSLKGILKPLKRSVVIEILKKSFPYALLSFLMVMYLRVDAVMLKIMLVDGDYWAGIYAHSYRIFDVLSMVGFLSASVLLPFFARKIKEGARLKKLLHQLGGSAIILALVVSAIGVWFAQDILALLYTEKVTEISLQTFQVLMLSLWAVAVFYVYSTFLTALGSLKTLNTIAALALGANIVLNAFLIPTYTSLGAAIASLISQSIAAIAFIVFAHKANK